MSAWVMLASSANCDKGPPGIIFSTVKPMIDTITSRIMLCHRRLNRNPAIQPPSGLQDFERNARALRLPGRRIRSGLTGPTRRIPGFAAGVAVADHATDVRLPALDGIL